MRKALKRCLFQVKADFGDIIRLKYMDLQLCTVIVSIKAMGVSGTLVIVLLAVGCLVAEDNNSPQISTPLGNVRGYYKTSYDGRTFSAFEGVPYAKPPIGRLRFEEPEEIEAWKGVWEATKPHTCLQPLEFAGSNLIGDEDCLYLNVYTPREQPSSADNLDVVVAIHGGAFVAGSGHSFTNPDYIMDRELILVTFNYRLGPLGFLSTEDDVVPGNNGLKDQVLALKWVQKHIKYFGGNPNSVTISGFSAGGSSVHYHYLSPLSKGLFHRGYSHSGTALLPWAFQSRPLERTRKLAALVGCLDSSSTRNIVECLKQRPAAQLAVNIKEFYGYSVLPIGNFGPTVEKITEGAFIAEYPYKILLNGPINDAPWINTFTREDGLLMVGFLANEINSLELDERWEEIAPYFLEYNYTVTDAEKAEIAKKVKQFYFGEERISESNIHKLVELSTDRDFKLESIKASKLQSKISKSPVYTAIYAYKGTYGFMDTFFSVGKDLGVGHGDDILLLFATAPGAKLSADDEKIKNILLDLLESFARTGVPQIEGINWEPSTSSAELTYLEINGPGDIKLKTDAHFQKSLDFWDSLHIAENQNIVALKDEL